MVNDAVTNNFNDLHGTCMNQALSVDMKKGTGMNLGHRLAICGAMALGLAAMPAAADTLHAFCSYTGNGNCNDNGTITPEFVTNQPSFGFNSSGNKGSYTEFLLTVLIPDNVKGANSENFSITGTNTGNATVAGNLFSSTAWTSGFLGAYLHISVNPDNPLGAWLPSTNTYQAKATGYYVYTLNFGSVAFSSNTDPTFSSSFSYPAGTVVTAFADQVTGKGDGAKSGWISTAQSGALLVGYAPVPVPEPDSLALVGGAFIGLAGLWLLRRRAGSAA